MFCSACGGTLVPGQAFCPQCGRPVAADAPVAPPIPPAAVPGFQFELNNFAGKIRALSVVWFIYGGLSVLGIRKAGISAFDFFRQLGTVAARQFPSAVVRAGTSAPCLALCATARGNGPDDWLGPAATAPWGKIVAIVTAIFNVLPGVPVRDGAGHLDAGDAGGISEFDVVRSACRKGRSQLSAISC